MITQIVGYIKEMVVQFGSRMAIQPSSCETIVGMYNIYLNNEKVQKNCANCAICVQMHTVFWAQMIMCECLDYYVLYLELCKIGLSSNIVVVALITHRIVTTDGI